MAFKDGDIVRLINDRFTQVPYGHVGIIVKDIVVFSGVPNYHPNPKAIPLTVASFHLSIMKRSIKHAELTELERLYYGITE